MSRFDLSKMGQKIEENKVELGKSYLNEASLSMRDTRKKTEYGYRKKCTRYVPINC